MASEPTAEQVWHMILSGKTSWEQDRRKFKLFPAEHRCKNCNAPLDGLWAWVARRMGRGPYKRNPRFCEF